MTCLQQQMTDLNGISDKSTTIRATIETDLQDFKDTEVTRD